MIIWIKNVTTILLTLHLQTTRYIKKIIQKVLIVMTACLHVRTHARKGTNLNLCKQISGYCYFHVFC